MSRWSALDRKLRIEMRTELKKIVDRVGITTIFVTHDQEEALTMSDRIAVMDHGNVIQDGTPMQIYDGRGTTFVASFVGNSNLFHGMVQADTRGCPILKSSDLHLVLPPDFEPQIGQEISILLRPEHLQVSPLTAEGNTHELGMMGTVSYVTLAWAFHRI